MSRKNLGPFWLEFGPYLIAAGKRSEGNVFIRLRTAAIKMDTKSDEEVSFSQLNTERWFAHLLRFFC